MCYFYFVTLRYTLNLSWFVTLTAPLLELFLLLCNYVFLSLKKKKKHVLIKPNSSELCGTGYEVLNLDFSLSYNNKNKKRKGKNEQRQNNEYRHFHSGRRDTTMHKLLKPVLITDWTFLTNFFSQLCVYRWVTNQKKTPTFAPSNTVYHKKKVG